MHRLFYMIVNFLCFLFSFIFNTRFINFILYCRKKTFSFALVRKIKKAGKNISMHYQTYILNPQYITIGNNFSSIYNLRIEAYDRYSNQVFNPEIIIGDNVGINSDCHIGCINRIEIGNNVLIASRVFITDHYHGNYDDLTNPPVLRSLVSKGPVIIGNNVWIGEGVSILPGITIGDNVIIGANSVVTKSFPENSVIAGVPARILSTSKNN